MARDDPEGAAPRPAWLRRPRADRPPGGAVSADLGGKGCCEPLCLVTEASAWRPGCEELFFKKQWAEGEGGIVRHQLCVRVAAVPDGPAGSKIPPATGEPRHALCPFQILSTQRQWDWLLYPLRKPRGSTAWGKENVLVPGVPDAVEVALGDQRRSRGRCFCVVEPPGTVVTVCVELSPDPSGSPAARIWYEASGSKPSFQLAPLVPFGAGRPDDGLAEPPTGGKAKGAESKLLDRPENAGRASEGPGDCSQELYLVCEASDWSLKEEKLVFQPMWSEPVETWSWTEHGVAEVQASKQAFGDPRPGSHFSEAHFEILASGAQADQPPVSYETLRQSGFIELGSKLRVRHHLGIRLGQAATLNKFSGEPAAWEFAFVSLTFQVLSRKRGWDWRLFPGRRPDEGGSDAWGTENVLVPGAPEAVPVTHGSQVHGRNFHIVEPHGTSVTVAVELLDRGRPEKPELHARVWYERSRASNCFVGCDARPPVKKEVFLALGLQGKDAPREYDCVVRARCPRWWRAWDQEEEGRRQAAAGGRRAWDAKRAWLAEVEAAWSLRSAVLELAQEAGAVTVAEAAPKDEDQQDASRPFTRNEAVDHLHWCISFLADKKHAPVLEECRQNSSVKCGLFETFPYLPPKAMSILSTMVQLVLDRAKCSSLHGFLDRFAAIAWDGKVSKMSERLTKLIETGADEPVADKDKPSKRRAAKGGGTGVRLSVGMAVTVKWKVDSDWSRYLSRLDGKLGTLTSFDKTTSRWTVTFRGPDSGSVEVTSEHLLAATAPSASPTPTEQPAAERGGGIKCDMCNQNFKESELIKVACGEGHRYCHGCLRQWALRQTVPRCYRCLFDRALLEMPKGVPPGRPWLSLVQSEAEATLEHKLLRTEVERLPCLCYGEVRPGAPCILMGHARSGERCLVGHITKGDDCMMGCAGAYLKDGTVVVVKAVSCLGPDDCEAAGRLARGQPCPAKALRFRYSSGLLCASLGCACMVREALDFLSMSRTSLPFDWLISRVEGVLYFLRHSFRDFCHHDGKSDIIHVDARPMTTFRSAYHAFLHHDMEESGMFETFRRRGERMMSLLTAPGRFGTAHPVLLVRLCAKSSELDAADELFAAVRLLGGPKAFLLVIVSEQSEHTGLVLHGFHQNLIFYVAGSTSASHKSPDILSAVRFAVDYASLMSSLGDARSCAEAYPVSKLSPVSSGAALRWQLSNQHQHWLKRDSRGRPSTSDVDGCFDPGPTQFFPGKFLRRGVLEASPHFSPDLLAAVEKGDPDRVMALAAGGADVNAWDVRGETLLFRAARRGDPVVCAALLLSAGDPNCRARNGSRVKDHVGSGRPTSGCVRTLLLLAGGLEPLPDGEALAALAVLPEPFRRQLCSRLGTRCAPEPVKRRPAAASGMLFLRQLLADAQARSDDHADALAKLRVAARGQPAHCRKVVRSLLRQWHPDKHCSRPREAQEHASDVFCYVRDICSLALGHKDLRLRAGGPGDR